MDIRKYIYGHCVHPVPIKVFDPCAGPNGKGCEVTRYVPCGKCIHCRNQKVNEWTTRLYAHSMYCKNVYYLTLDYKSFDLKDPNSANLAAETGACWHHLCQTKKRGLHPILLNKNHLQDYFKRLRKRFPARTFQYFACGEYGHVFGRPHFHVILFSNDNWTPDDLFSAWTINGYQIGEKSDFHDLRKNGTFLENKKDSKLNAKFVFSYVCKYLQKGKFDFENLPTIKFHKQYFEKMETWKLEEGQEITDEMRKQDWKSYCKMFNPFVCCSKRPAIGLQYFEDNVQRFKMQDFRLFGLSTQCKAFPSYFLRKTKDALCGYYAISCNTGSPSSQSRLGNIVSVLDQIRDNWRDPQLMSDPSALVWRAGRGNSTIYGYQNTKDEEESYNHNVINNLNYSFYDIKARLLFLWNGHDFTLIRKVRKIGFVTICHMTLDECVCLLHSNWDTYYDTFLRKFDIKRKQMEKELEFEKMKFFNIKDPEKAQEKFEKFVESEYRLIIADWNNVANIIKNKKQSF